uniref:Uncharacterized protein n=1 Tax=Panagrolaimus sp. ES5 TaxID=591445 RepID=A0AC34EZQ6_9BILA
MIYGYEKNVDIVIAHRHFDLSRNEVMFEKAEGDARFVKPIEYQKLSSLGASPSVIICGKDGEWHPVEYETRTSESRFVPETDVSSLSLSQT